jgi:5-formyltetrahydrofolate cyclo-ligase
LKDTLRKQILDARAALSPAVRQAKSALIEERLFALPAFHDATVVMFFASFRSEADTHHMIRRALAEGKRVVLPKVQGKTLVLLEIGDFDRDVSAGAWGIPEPRSGRPVRLRDIGLIIVPGAAFDERGNRVGYGAGFYDHLLADYPGATVAVAFELQVAPSVPTEPHDVPVKLIVTEDRVIDCRKPAGG